MWQSEDLFNKAAYLIGKGLNHEEPESDEVPFWSFIGLELLARAVLSRINTALLADPTDGNNILYACGFPSTKSPKSIPAKSVFHRCTTVCPNFTTKEYDQCLIWLNWRNEELHTAAFPFSQIKSSEWMPRFFQIVGILVENSDRTLADLIGAGNLDTAKSMIDALSAENKKVAYQIIKKAKGAFNELGVEERLKKIGDGKSLRHTDQTFSGGGYEIICPACEGPAYVYGDLIRLTNPRDDEGDLVRDAVSLPKKLKCFACNLTLDGHAMLHAIGEGDQYTRAVQLDPKEYYEIHFNEEDYFMSEYSND